MEKSLAVIFFNPYLKKNKSYYLNKLIIYELKGI